MDTAAVTLSDGRRAVLKRRKRPVTAAPTGAAAAEAMAAFRRSNPAATTTSATGAAAAPAMANLSAERRKRFLAMTALSGRPAQELWTEKHAPKKFMELLSEERTNREVLRAIKAWDRYVFGREPNPSNPMSDEDGDRRPEKRIILLCGPPGAGKTTLAQVSLAQAGYNVVEVNASDDRTASVLRDRLTGAFTCNAISGPNANKPSAVILDEIDGADGKGGVDMLLQMARAPLRRRGNDQAKDGSTKPRRRGTGATRTTPVTRPLVCICNDLYAPHLRALREVAIVFRLEGCPPRRLAGRLRTICTHERAAVSSSTLNRLVASSNYDVRACLHSLQLVTAATRTAAYASLGETEAAPTRSPHVDISAALEMQLEVGLKDEGRDVMDCLQHVFWAEKRGGAAPVPNASRGGNRGGGGGGGGGGKPGFRMDTSGIDAARLLSALHERMLDADLRVHDPGCGRALRALDAFGAADLLLNFGGGFGGGALAAYGKLLAPGVVAQTHRGMHRPRLAPPRKDWEMRQRARASAAVLSDFGGGGIGGRVGGGTHMDRGALRLEVVPAMAAMFGVRVRSGVPFTGLRQREQEQLCHAAEVLHAASVRIVAKPVWDDHPPPSNPKAPLRPSNAGEENANPNAPAAAPAGPRMVARLDPPVDELLLGREGKPLALPPALSSIEVLQRVRARRDKANGVAGALPAHVKDTASGPGAAPASRKRKAASEKPAPAKKVVYKFQAGVTNAVKRVLKVRNLTEDWGWAAAP